MLGPGGLQQYQALPAVDVDARLVPATPEASIFMLASSPVVAATSAFVNWQPEPAGANGPLVSLPLHEAFSAFLIRNKVGPAPADKAAARLAHPLILRFTDAAWGRYLTALQSGGLFHAVQLAHSLPDFHKRLLDASSIPLADLDVLAADWALAPAFTLGAQAVQARMRKVAFLTLATVRRRGAAYGGTALTAAAGARLRAPGAATFEARPMG